MLSSDPLPSTLLLVDKTCLQGKVRHKQDRCCVLSPEFGIVGVEIVAITKRFEWYHCCCDTKGN